MKQLAIIAMALTASVPALAQSSKDPDATVYQKCMQKFPKDVPKTYFTPQMNCSKAAFDRCYKRTNDWFKCMEQDNSRTREAQSIGMRLLIQESDRCVLEWSKAYAVSTQENVQTVIDAAYSKCSEFTNPMIGVLSNTTHEPEGGLADNYKKKFISLVLDARMKVGSGAITQSPQPTSKAF